MRRFVKAAMVLSVLLHLGFWNGLASGAERNGKAVNRGVPTPDSLSANSDGNRHLHTNLPVILAGHAGGTLNPGRYTKFNDEPVTNLFLSMMDRVEGAQSLPRFGDSTGRLANI